MAKHAAKSALDVAAIGEDDAFVDTVGQEDVDAMVGADARDVAEAGQDAVALLMADHQKVKILFDRFDKLKDGGNEDEKAAVVRQICEELTLHTQVEEEIFYPAVREAIGDDDLMDEAVVEHAGAKRLVAELFQAHPEDDLYDARVTVLSEQVDHHVTEEEGVMFPKAQASSADLEALGAKLAARKAQLSSGEGRSPQARDASSAPESTAAHTHSHNATAKSTAAEKATSAPKSGSSPKSTAKKTRRRA